MLNCNKPKSAQWKKSFRSLSTCANCQEQHTVSKASSVWKAWGNHSFEISAKLFLCPIPATWQENQNTEQVKYGAQTFDLGNQNPQIEKNIVRSAVIQLLVDQYGCLFLFKWTSKRQLLCFSEKESAHERSQVMALIDLPFAFEAKIQNL